MPDDTQRPGSPTNGSPTNGHSNGFPHPVPPFSRSLPDEDASSPTDLVAVQADDELLNALGARPAVLPGAPPVDRAGPATFGAASGSDAGPSLPTGDIGGHGADDRLVAMLAAWRAEIDAEPIPELVDLDTAVAAVTAGIAEQSTAARRRRAGRLRQLAPLVAAAAIIVTTVAGVGVGAQDAMPGDTLWAIQKVVDPERAESVEAKVKVESRLETVRTALKNGDTATAAEQLEAIRTEIRAVRGEEGQPQLEQEQEFLAAKLADTQPGQHADLSTPPKSNPAAHPTESPGSPPGPPADVRVTEPSASQSETAPPPTEPDVHQSAPDRARDAIVQVSPGHTEPVKPAPEGTVTDVTRAPEVTQPQPHPDPTSPDKSEGKPDPTVAPGPVDQPPASATDTGTSSDVGARTGGGHAADTPGDAAAGTTAAAGSAGADITTTATGTT
jgi:hypothetical protein